MVAIKQITVLTDWSSSSQINANELIERQERRLIKFEIFNPSFKMIQPKSLF